MVVARCDTERLNRVGGPFNYGQCCCCGAEPATIIYLLDGEAPERGKGWGCRLCKLPFDGAYAVVCDKCDAAVTMGYDALRFVVHGPLKDGGRAPINQVRGSHSHSKECFVARLPVDL